MAKISNGKSLTKTGPFILAESGLKKKFANNVKIAAQFLIKLY